MRAKKMRQDGAAEFISASLNTVGVLKRASLERKNSDGAYQALYSLASLGFALALRNLLYSTENYTRQSYNRQAMHLVGSSSKMLEESLIFTTRSARRPMSRRKRSRRRLYRRTTNWSPRGKRSSPIRRSFAKRSASQLPCRKKRASWMKKWRCLWK